MRRGKTPVLREDTSGCLYTLESYDSPSLPKRGY